MPADEISIHQIHAGDGDGADVIFDFNGQLIAVSIFPSSSMRSQKQPFVNDRLIDLLGRAVSADMDDDDDDYEEVVDEVLGVILDAGRPIFTQAAIPVKSVPTHLGRDLQSFLSPARLTFQLLETARGTTTIVPIDPSEAYTYPSCEARCDSSDEDGFGIHTILPQHSAKEILVAETFVEGAGHIASRVWVDGEEMFCKDHGDGRRLLLGYVVHADTGRVIGFLRQWVSGCRLKDVNILATSAERRRKWASQIRETVDCLHAIGVIWGDGKDSNIIIDEGDDAWLIDFGGGYTKGWVDEELADTMEGTSRRSGILQIS